MFTRAAGGLRLTEMGAALLAQGQDMAAASARLETIASSRDVRVSGTVRLTASVVVAHYILPPILKTLRTAEPGIEIELVAPDTSENLLMREADIAIRMFRPTQLDIVTRKIAESPLVLYAPSELLSRFGQPENFDNLREMPFVGFDRSDMILRQCREWGFDVDRAFFGVRCDDQAAYWRLVVDGCGVGGMQTVTGDAEANVQKLAFQPQISPLPLWLAAHGAMRTTPRVRRVWEFLAHALSCALKDSA